MIKKFKSASKEDANLFYFEEKFRSASKEDADPFYFEEKELITCRSLKLQNKLYQRTIYAIKLNWQGRIWIFKTIKHVSSW